MGSKDALVSTIRHGLGEREYGYNISAHEALDSLVNVNKNKYGELKVICGPMFAGKSSELLKTILWTRNGQNRNVLVVKPAFDCRYSKTEVVTHDGLSTTANSIDSWDNIRNEAENSEIIFLDEVQFFSPPLFDGDIVGIVESYLKKGKQLIVNGLDMDWRGKPFPITASLMAMADEVVKLTSNCAICGRPATKTYKKITDGVSVELGGANLYEPRCNSHWEYPTKID